MKVSDLISWLFSFGNLPSLQWKPSVKVALHNPEAITIMFNDVLIKEL